MQHPVHTLMNKTSVGFRAAFEQLTGEDPSGQELGFKEKNFFRGFFEGEKGFTDSRVAYLGRKIFIPMSILPLLDGGVTTFVAPVSKGMTMWKAQTEFAKYLTAYADDRVWNKIEGNETREVNLRVLGREILEGARRNGLNTDKVISGARCKVMTELYRDFFNYLNEGKQAKLDKVAESILRVNGNMKNTLKSMNYRFSSTTKELTPEKLANIEEAFGK